MPDVTRLGQLLLRSHLVTEAQLQNALAEQQRWGGKLGEILVRMSYLPEESLVEALSRQLGVATVDLRRAVERVPAAVAARVPAATARRCRAVPLAVGHEGKSLAVAMADPRDLRALDELRTVTGGARIVPYLAGPRAIARALDWLYRAREALDEDETGELALVDALGRPYEPAAGNGAGKNGANGYAAGNGVTAAAAVAMGYMVPAPNGMPVAAAGGAPVPAGPDGAPAPTVAGGTAPGTPGGTWPSAPAVAPAVASGPAAGAPASAAPGVGAEVLAILRRLDARQRDETRLVVALVDLLVERGLFTREEFLARVRR
jgi:hypothetical protein